MLPLPDALVYVELPLLFVICLPLGAVTLRGAERLIGRRIELTPVERILLAFFAAGGVLFVIASIPLPLYGVGAVAGLLTVGLVAYVAISVREAASGLREILRFVRTAPGSILLGGTLALLFLEVTSGSVVLPNGIDGSVQALFVNQLLTTHSVAWNLEPYASVGVTYPQGTAVWMSLPVVLFGWPIAAAPVSLPPLFLCLGPAAAFCLGARLVRSPRWPPQWSGMLFAGFFGLVASWPRLYIGGSYDFILGFPLFLVLLGFMRPFAQGSRTWREAVALGGLLGVASVVSATIGTVLALVLLVQMVLCSWSDLSRLGRLLLRFVVVVGVAALFLIRSFVGVIVWWSYPGHVQTSGSVPPYSPAVNQVVYGDFVSEVNPFSPWKWKISPFPVLALELQILLLVGGVLCILVLATSGGRLSHLLPREVATWTVANTLVPLALIGVVAAGREWSTSKSGIQAVTNLWELSILLFLFYSLIALLPIVAATTYLLAQREQRGRGAGTPDFYPPGRDLHGHPRAASSRPWVTAVMVLVVAMPLASGAVVSAAEAPGYLHTYLLGQSNGTADDVSVLEWAGSHLPPCSEVLVAPGSAAQFLPEYAKVGMITPVYPTPTNLTYYDVVSNLTAGVYDASTREGMLTLGVTEVFVTGATTDTYAPFSPTPMHESADFSILVSSGDAMIFAFEPGIRASACPPG